MSDSQLDELRLTTEIILQAAELIQTLECEEPNEASRGYFINDSLDTEALRVPWAIEAIVDGPPEEVIVTFDTMDGQLRESINIKLVYASVVATITRDGSMPAYEPFVVELASTMDNAYSITEITPEDVSNLVASLLYPRNTPELAQYRDPNDRATAEEIQDVLRETASDSHTGLMTYMANDGVTEIISADDGEKITDIDVVWTISNEMYFSTDLGMPVHAVRKLVAKMALDPSEKGIAFFIQDGVNAKGIEFVPDRDDLEKLKAILQLSAPESLRAVSFNENENLG